LTVPDSLYSEVERLAEQLGTTTNDALIRLAEEAAAARARRAEIEAIAAARRAAIDDVGPVEWNDLPSPDEMRAAMLSGRSH
jgi:hypothetical protein